MRKIVSCLLIAGAAAAPGALRADDALQGMTMDVMEADESPRQAAGRIAVPPSPTKIAGPTTNEARDRNPSTAGDPHEDARDRQGDMGGNGGGGEDPGFGGVGGILDPGASAGGDQSANDYGDDWSTESEPEGNAYAYGHDEDKGKPDKD